MGATTKKKWNKRTLRVFSRHPSHSVIRKKILASVLACVRFGSSTAWNRSEYELNSIEAVGNSSNKVRMKTLFDEHGVKTAQWWQSPMQLDGMKDEIPFPLIAKRINGSRGRGMVKIDSSEELLEFVKGNTNIKNYIFEKYHNYVREYRLHVDAQGCFYTCRKMLKSDTPEDQRWFRNDSNCTWFLEENEKFDRPVNWQAIEEECVKALNAVGLDFGACDVRVQGSKTSKGKDRKEPDFIIVEINSAPSFGEVTAEKYAERLPETLANKYNL